MKSTYEHIKDCIKWLEDEGVKSKGLTLFANYHNELYPSFKDVPTNLDFIFNMEEIDESSYENGDQQEDQFIKLITQAIDKLIEEHAFDNIIEERPFPIFYRFWDHTKHLHFIYKAEKPKPFFPTFKESELSLKIPQHNEFDSNKWWRLVPCTVTFEYPDYRHFYENGHIEFHYKNEDWIDFQTTESLKNKAIEISLESDDMIQKLWDVPQYEYGFLMSYKLAELIQLMNISDIEIFPVKIRDIVREKSNNDYYKIANILSTSDAFQYYKKEGGKVKRFISYQHQIRGIKNKLEALKNVHITRSSLRKRDIIVSDFFKVACEQNNLSGLYFEKIPIY